MPDEPLEEELRRILDADRSLSDENRRLLARQLDLIASDRESLAAMPGLPPGTMERWHEEIRSCWLMFLESCRDGEKDEDDLLTAAATRADALRVVKFQSLRAARAFRAMIEGGDFPGTWEEREELMELVHEIEACKESYLAELPAEDIRKLRDEGAI